MIRRHGVLNAQSLAYKINVEQLRGVKLGGWVGVEDMQPHAGGSYNHPRCVLLTHLL